MVHYDKIKIKGAPCGRVYRPDVLGWVCGGVVVGVGVGRMWFEKDYRLDGYFEKTIFTEE
eukprot:1191521-Prorocentrum_minimum.AAC.4